MAPSNEHVVPDVVKIRFGDRVDAAERLYRTCSKFRELCSDYRDCVAAVQHFKAQGVTLTERVNEYVDMQENLEKELTYCLDASQRGGCEVNCSRFLPTDGTDPADQGKNFKKEA